MVGIYTQPITGAASVEALGTEAIPSSTGEVLGAEATGGFLGSFLGYGATRYGVETMGADPSTGEPIPGFHDTDLSPEEATARYGIKGRLQWPAPVPQSVAEEQSRRQREAIAREDVIARREGGLLTGGAARLGAGLIGGLPGLIDPLNIAASFLPFVPEARAALWAARGGLAGRAGTGAVEGMAGQALLTPLQYGLSKAEGEDYGAVDAILNIALGGVFGGGLHTGAALLGRRGIDLAGAIDRADPEVREGLLRGALADIAEDRPVTSPGEIAARAPEEPRGWRGMSRTATEDERAAQRERDQRTYSTSLTPHETVPQEPLRLASYLAREGGVQESGGALRYIGAGDRPGLINRNGISLDDAALKAWEAGFLPGAERPDINALIDALDRDLKGQPVYRAGDEHAAASHQDALERNREIDRLAQEHGIEPRGLNHQQFFDQIAEKIGRPAATAEAERLAGESQAIMQRAEAEGWLPDFGEGEPRTAEEIENAYRQESAARRAETRPLGLAEFGSDRPAARSLEAGDGQGGRGAGARPGGAGELPRELSAEAARDPLQLLAEDTAALDREIAQAKAAGELPEDSAELAAADALKAEAEANARALEQGGACLGRRL